jgi:phage-related protein
MLELGHPEKSGFLVQSIDGLGPSKANINATELSTSDGSLFNSSRVTSRNIILQLKFLENPTIEDTRQLSYKYFPIKRRIRLLFETDNRVCEIYGNVESNTPNIFSKSEGTQISIFCPDPYFYSVEKTVTVFSGIESEFEFPFENESLNENLLEFGEVRTDLIQNIYYSGDAEIGVLISIHATGDVSNITIYNTDTRESMKIDGARLTSLTGSGIIAGDDIFISTVRGNKYISLLRGGIYYNILNCLDKNTNWFQISKGNNTFAYTAETGIDKLEFMIENQTVYEGV